MQQLFWYMTGLVRVSRDRPFDFWRSGGGGGGEYGWFGLGKNFFPAKPLAIELNFFFRDKQMCKIFSTLSAMKDIFFSVRFFSSGISLKKSFPSNYSVLVFVFVFVFLKSPIPTLKSQMVGPLEPWWQINNVLRILLVQFKNIFNNETGMNMHLTFYQGQLTCIKMIKTKLMDKRA